MSVIAEGKLENAVSGTFFGLITISTDAASSAVSPDDGKASDQKTAVKIRRWLLQLLKKRLCIISGSKRLTCM